MLTNKKSCWVGGLCHCPVHGPRTHNKFYKEVNWKKTKRYYWRRRYYLLFSIWFLRPYTFSWRGVVEKDNFGTKQQLAIPPTASSQLFRLRWSNSIKLLSSAPLETAVGKVRRLIIFFSFPLLISVIRASHAVIRNPSCLQDKHQCFLSIYLSIYLWSWAVVDFCYFALKFHFLEVG